MIYSEIKGDLFDVSEDYYLAHCISSDAALGAGIAVLFEEKYDLRKQLLELPGEHLKHPTCIKIDKVFNLITKDKCYHKPTYQTLSMALMKMKNSAVDQGIAKIAMPAIGSGLDKLSWHRVKEIIQAIFKDTDIEILVVIKE